MEHNVSSCLVSMPALRAGVKPRRLLDPVVLGELLGDEDAHQEVLLVWDVLSDVQEVHGFHLASSGRSSHWLSLWFTISTYFWDLSTPIYCLPSFLAAKAVVPDPIKGSNTMLAVVD